MSYVYSRDNSEIEGRLSASDLERVQTISEHVDRLYVLGNHADLCGCDAPACTTRGHLECREAGSEETIAWLSAQGYLNLDDVLEGM